MRRRSDWHQRLTSYLMATRRALFAYGSHDCAVWTAGAVEAMTGEDVGAGWRGAYATEAEGLAELRAAGWDDHVALAASLLPEIEPRQARPGDVAAVATADGVALGVVQGPYVYVPQARGVALVDRAAMSRAFRLEG